MGSSRDTAAGRGLRLCLPTQEEGQGWGEKSPSQPWALISMEEDRVGGHVGGQHTSTHGRDLSICKGNSDQSPEVEIES